MARLSCPPCFALRATHGAASLHSLRELRLGKPSQFIVAKRVTAAQAVRFLLVPMIRYVAPVPWSTEEQDGLSRRCPGGDARSAISFAGTSQACGKSPQPPLIRIFEGIPEDHVRSASQPALQLGVSPSPLVTRAWAELRAHPRGCPKAQTSSRIEAGSLFAVTFSRGS